MKSRSRYSLLAAVALICAGLAALGSFRAFPRHSGQVRSVFLGLVAGATVIEGAALFPTKPHTRLLVKREILTAGWLMFFAVAALLLAILFAGCSQVAVWIGSNNQFSRGVQKRGSELVALTFRIPCQRRDTARFCNQRQFPGPWPARPVPGALTCCRCGLNTGPERVLWAETNRCRELAARIKTIA